jgi:hypothetical protein
MFHAQSAGALFLYAFDEHWQRFLALFFHLLNE